MFYNTIKNILSCVLFFLAKVEVKGLDNLPAQGPVVLASNHASNWDPVILGAFIPRKLTFMAKEELFKIFLIGYIVRNVEAIPVKRGKSDRNAIRLSIKALEEGKAMCIFPEGTRSKSGELLEFQPGATMLAYKGNAPIVPIALKNTKNIGKGLLPKIQIIIGEPLRIEENGEEKITGQHLDQLTQKLQGQVQQLLRS